MREPVHGGRGDDDGMRPDPPEYRRLRVALRNIDQHARPDLDPPPGLHVAGEGQLVARAARVIAVRARVQNLVRPLLEVANRAWLESSRARSRSAPGLASRTLAFRGSLVD
jgi:hypothetical protein